MSTRFQKIISGLFLVSAASLLFAGCSLYPTTTVNVTPSAAPTAAMMANKVDLQFGNHPGMKLPEQDVFVMGPVASEVWRLEAVDALKPENMKKMVYSTAAMTPHDPFKIGARPLGPFAKGASLGFTLDDWLAASGSGTYSWEGDKAQLNLSFTKLVPNATYTVWCSRLTFPPNPKIVDSPCGAADGSENTFKTDPSGNGSFMLSLKPLEESTKETATVIAVAYHRDGKTYGAEPGDFGKVTHVQIVALIPVPTATSTVSK
ncbi:hypothetical protein HY030_00640 [Candidatus Gottesmanbacteria bacterium]|nr:hypothetical protein [Candidatus Gottesmanbacteria bacterium]